MNWQKMILTRDSLLDRLKNLDDHESWKDFFETYWRLIHNVAVQAGLNEAEAQDVVQATVITVAKNIQQVRTGRQHGSFKGWLLTTTRWRIVDQFRKRRPGDAINNIPTPETNRTAVMERIPDPAASDLNAVWDREWEENILQVAIDTVKQRVEPQIYQLFDLHSVQNWPAAKVASKLDVTINQVYAAKYKVSDLIKREVTRLRKKPI